MGIKFGNSQNVNSGYSPEGRLSYLSGELEKTFDKLGACIPVEVRSVEELNSCVRDAERFLSLLYQARTTIRTLRR